MPCTVERMRILDAVRCGNCARWIPPDLVVRVFTSRESGLLPKQGYWCAPCDWAMWRTEAGRAYRTVTARDVAEYRRSPGWKTA